MPPSPENYSPVLIAETQGEVAHLTLNRPDRRNALSAELLRELDVALARIADDHRIRAVVIAARGPVFCSGHDLGEMREPEANAGSGWDAVPRYRGHGHPSSRVIRPSVSCWR